MIIRYAALIFTLTTLFYSCVDVIPIPAEGGPEQPMFVVCEMKVGQQIKANVSLSGNTTGTPPKELPHPDSLFMSLAEGEYDFGVDFEYDKVSGSFLIDQDKLMLKTGVSYKIRGIGTDRKKKSDPAIVIPSVVLVDTVTVNKKNTVQINDDFVTTVECMIKLQKYNTAPGFLYIVPSTDAQNFWSVTAFDRNASSFKRLNHRKGFLVDYSGIQNDELYITFSVTEKNLTSTLHLEVNHVTESFYRYNNFVSNVSASNFLMAENPSIAGLNINTNLALGTFSAMQPSYKKVTLR